MKTLFLLSIVLLYLYFKYLWAWDSEPKGNAKGKKTTTYYDKEGRVTNERNAHFSSDSYEF